MSNQLAGGLGANTKLVLRGSRSLLGSSQVDRCDAAVWYSPPHVTCLRIDSATRQELVVIARGRALLIDYFATAGWFGLRFGDVTFRWLDDLVQLPAGALLVDDFSEPPTFVRPHLAALLIRGRARFRILGPRRLRFLRRPAITLCDEGLWLEFFGIHAAPLGRIR